MKNLENLIVRIRQLKIKRKTLLIGIDGRGGVGKTTLALKIKEHFPEARIVTTDDFYNQDIEKIDENWLYEQVLKPLSEDRAITYQQFLGKENKIVTRTIEPGGIVIIEGVYATHS